MLRGPSDYDPECLVFVGFLQPRHFYPIKLQMALENKAKSGWRMSNHVRKAFLCRCKKGIMARSSQDKEIIVRDNGYLAKYCAWHTPTITAFGRKG